MEFFRLVQFAAIGLVGAYLAFTSEAQGTRAVEIVRRLWGVDASERQYRFAYRWGGVAMAGLAIVAIVSELFR